MKESSMRLSILFSAFLVLATALPAEDIILIDGRYLHVKILTPSEQGLQVQLLDTGGQVFLPWGLIYETDRTRLMKEFGYLNEEKVYVEDGHVVTTKMGDTYEGLVISDTADSIVLKRQGTPLPIPKSSIKDLEKRSVNVLEIYTPDEFYNKRAGEMKVPDDDIQGNMELADLAFTLGLYEKSFRHYQKVQAVDPLYEEKFIANRLKTLEELSKNKQISDLIKQARNDALHNLYPKAFKAFDEILGLKDLPQGLKAEAEVYKQRAIKQRYEYFRRKVREDYEGTLKNKIAALSRDSKLKLEEARRKLRSDVHKEVVTDIATRLQLDPKEVEKMWEERGFNQPRIASYGSGSFIVLGRSPNAEKYDQEMQKYLQSALRQQQQQQGRNNEGGSLSAPADKMPKPPTKEEWWTKVSDSADREGWMRAFWAENSKKVTVVGDRWEDCSRCGGTGALKFSGSQGDTMRTTCPACQGHQRFKGVAYK
jgi:tetratricopeptide (TPR) repeat protein